MTGSIETRPARLRLEYPLLCDACGAPHWMDVSIPSRLWNQIARPEDTLCLLCIDDRLAAHNLSCDVAEFYFVGKALKSRAYEGQAARS